MARQFSGCLLRAARKRPGLNREQLAVSAGYLPRRLAAGKETKLHPASMLQPRSPRSSAVGMLRRLRQLGGQPQARGHRAASPTAARTSGT